MRKLEHNAPPSRFQQAMNLAQPRRRTVQVSQPEGHGHDVEHRIGKGYAERVTFDKLDRQPRPPDFFDPQFQHWMTEVNSECRSQLAEFQRQLSRSAAKVECHSARA